MLGLTLLGAHTHAREEKAKWRAIQHCGGLESARREPGALSFAFP